MTDSPYEEIAKLRLDVTRMSSEHLRNRLTSDHFLVCYSKDGDEREFYLNCEEIIKNELKERDKHD